MSDKDKNKTEEQLAQEKAAQEKAARGKAIQDLEEGLLKLAGLPERLEALFKNIPSKDAPFSEPAAIAKKLAQVNQLVSDLKEVSA